MGSMTSLRVHISPVGYEVDRVVLPAVEMRADRVYLLVHENPSEDKAAPHYERIEEMLSELQTESRRVLHDRRDIFSIMRSVKCIIDENVGNSIYVNLASGSKIQAVACMMAGMLFNDSGNVVPFYVEAAEYPGFNGQMPTGIRDIQQIPRYEIKKPESRLIDALRILDECGGRISKKEMARRAVENKMITVNAENAPQAEFASLEANVIAPLVRWNFVRIEKVGRTRWIQITQDGRNASRFLL